MINNENMEPNSISTFNKTEHSSLVFEWTISNYNTLKVKELKNSIKFASTNEPKTEWFIEITPIKIREKSNDKLKIILYRSGHDKRFVEVTIYLKGPSNKWIKFCNPFSGYLLDYTNFIVFKKTTDSLAERLHWKDDSNDALSIKAEISTQTTHEDKLKLDFQTQNLVNDVSKMYEEPTFQDVTFLCKTTEFSAHKFILSARSEVFAGMFRCTMTEKITSKVKIEDIEPEIFKTILQFIYHDQVDNLKTVALNLFVAAHKYQIKKLENLCIAAMYENMNTNNILQIVQLSDVYELVELRKKALEFIKLHVEELKYTTEFLLLMRNYPSVVLDLLSA